MALAKVNRLFAVTLSGMSSWSSLVQTEPNKLFRFRSTWSGADEYRIQLNAHAS
jgi:hypothetical protein